MPILIPRFGKDRRVGLHLLAQTRSGARRDGGAYLDVRLEVGQQVVKQDMIVDAEAVGRLLGLPGGSPKPVQSLGALVNVDHPQPCVVGSGGAQRGEWRVSCATGR